MIKVQPGSSSSYFCRLCASHARDLKVKVSVSETFTSPGTAVSMSKQCLLLLSWRIRPGRFTLLVQSVLVAMSHIMMMFSVSVNFSGLEVSQLSDVVDDVDGMFFMLVIQLAFALITQIEDVSLVCVECLILLCWENSPQSPHHHSCCC